VSEVEAKIKKAAKEKVGYYLQSGRRVAGVTTILGVINKPALVVWANKLGLEGINSTEYTRALAVIGSLTHKRILFDLKGQDYREADEGNSPSTIEVSDNCFLSYLNWKAGKVLEPIFLEKAFVSERYGYGGTFDFYGNVDRRLTLIDFKTGSGIYPEHFIQMGAYGRLLSENGFALPQDYMVLNIPRAATDAFDSKTRSNLENEWEIFLAALVIYERMKVKD
jgi:hypothetical protein